MRLPSSCKPQRDDGITPGRRLVKHLYADVQNGLIHRLVTPGQNCSFGSSPLWKRSTPFLLALCVEHSALNSALYSPLLSPLIPSYLGNRACVKAVLDNLVETVRALDTVYKKPCLLIFTCFFTPRILKTDFMKYNKMRNKYIKKRVILFD